MYSYKEVEGEGSHRQVITFYEIEEIDISQIVEQVVQQFYESGEAFIGETEVVLIDTYEEDDVIVTINIEEYKDEIIKQLQKDVEEGEEEFKEDVRDILNEFQIKTK